MNAFRLPASARFKIGAGLIAGTCGIALAAPEYPALRGATESGRTVWIETCENCHAYGVAGAPDPAAADDWKDRLQKKPAVLYQHAIEGFFGPDDTYMPPRGGNDVLTDDEVRAAVDYMVALARHHAKRHKEEKQ